MYDWILYLYNNEEKMELLTRGKVYGGRDAWGAARDFLKKEMQEGSLLLGDSIKFLIDGNVHFVGTIGDFTKASASRRIGW